MWNEKEVSKYDAVPIVWPCPLTIRMILTLEFQGHFSGMGWPIGLERKGSESSIHDHDID